MWHAMWRGTDHTQRQIRWIWVTWQTIYVLKSCWIYFLIFPQISSVHWLDGKFCDEGDVDNGAGEKNSKPRTHFHVVILYSTLYYWFASLHRFISGFSCCSSSPISTFLCRSAAQINNAFHAFCCQWNVDLLPLRMFFYILIIWDKRGFSEAENVSTWTVKIACPFFLLVLCDAVDLWPFTWQPVICHCM